MVVCFVVEFSVSIEQTVEEESEASPAKPEEADNLERFVHFCSLPMFNGSALSTGARDAADRSGAWS